MGRTNRMCVYYKTWKESMKQYMLYLTNCSNHNSLIEKDINGNPLTKETALDYAKNIKGHSVYLIEGKKTLIHS